MNVAAQLVERFRQRDRRALARLLTWAADDETAPLVRAALDSSSAARGRAPVIAFTGNGGVGKSTLIGKLVGRLRGLGKTVAVLACDPQSPVSGGALLGDRVRIHPSAADDGVFIRSVATVAGRQGVADHVELMTDLLASFAFDVVLLETVGAGQGDTAVRDVADIVVLLVQPETGDELQWEKAGVLEIADLVAVNKSDLPGADRTVAQLHDALHLPGCPPKPVLRISGGKNEGIAELWAAIEAALPAS